VRFSEAGVDVIDQDEHGTRLTDRELWQISVAESLALNDLNSRMEIRINLDGRREGGSA
jgi:hypothetical protein